MMRSEGEMWPGPRHLSPRCGWPASCPCWTGGGVAGAVHTIVQRPPLPHCSPAVLDACRQFTENPEKTTESWGAAGSRRNPSSVPRRDPALFRVPRRREVSHPPRPALAVPALSGNQPWRSCPLQSGRQCLPCSRGPCGDKPGVSSTHFPAE